MNTYGHVVDDEGKPLEVYHGTTKDFDKFVLGHPERKDVGWLGHGLYFTNSRDMAQANAQMKAKRVGGTPKVMSVNLSLQNPYYATLEDKARLQKANSSEASKAFTEALKSKGHDGVIWKSGDYHEYVAFDPDQVMIKKAEGGEVEDYRGFHTSPGPQSGAPLHDLTQILPDDVYGPNAVRYYGTGDVKKDRESFAKVHRLRGKPNQGVQIYRAVPKDPSIKQINPKDWVTINRDYAVDHGESALRGKYKILSKVVSAKHLYNSGDSIHEWGYHPDPVEKAEGGEVDSDLKTAKRLGMDTSSIPEIRKAGQLREAYKTLGKKIREGSMAAAQRAKEYHESGKLPFPVGTRFTTEHSRKNKLPPFKVLAHYVDHKDPERYGYRTEQGEEGRGDYTSGIQLVSDPKADTQLEKLGKPFDRKAYWDNVQVLGGITRVKAEGGEVKEKTPISDWSWRPMSEVQEQLGGLQEIPSHVLNFGKFMDDTANKAGAKGLSARDLIKAFTITRASIQRGAVDADKVRAAGLDLDPSISGKVRPEGAFGEWLHTDMGQRYLKNAERGLVDPVSISNAVQIMAPFGRHTTDIPDALTWAAKNIPGKEKGVSLLVVAAQQGTSDPSQWREFIKDIKGIGPSKAGFVASLLGRGDQPTLDARQLILHTGQPSKAAAPYLKRKGGADEAVERLAERQRQMNLSIPSNLSPYYQHLAHHTVWDAVGGDETTHQDVINAMQNAAQGGRIESNPLIDHPFVNVMQAMGLPVFGKKPKPVVKKATGGPVSLDAMRLALLNRPKMAEGGDVDSPFPRGRAQRRMAVKSSVGPQPLTISKEPGGQWIGGKFGGVEQVVNRYKQMGDATPEKQAVNNWLDTTLTKYMKRDFGTEKDPVRMLMEEGITHHENPEAIEAAGFFGDPSWLLQRRKQYGMPENLISKNVLAKKWESGADKMIGTSSAEELIKRHPYAVEMLSENPWIKKVDPKTKIHFFDTGLGGEINFRHLTDELHNSLLENSNLPQSLKLRPESLSRMSVPQAVRHVHKINEWRKDNRAESNLEKSINSAVHLHKDYPDSNLAWYEIKHPAMTADEQAALRDADLESIEDAPESLQSKYKALEEALQYEGDTMGHCVGGYADDVASGNSRIFSLRNKRTGEPHVTIEATAPQMRGGQSAEQYRNTPFDIAQIKGKGNAKPVSKYIPFVQDFVKSGKWGDVGEIENADLIHVGNVLTPKERDDLRKQGHEVGDYVSKEDLIRFKSPPTGSVVRKAGGGLIKETVMPTLAQMKMALSGRPKDLQSIGAQEAPDMTPKSYLPPDRRGMLPPGGVATPSGMPIGGIDMSQMPGQQLMPTNALQPQGGLPQGADQGSPVAPNAPQSNILQMTPQGQQMAAMTPSAPQQPQQPQQMQDGGVVQYPTISDGVFKAEDDQPGLFRATGMAEGGMAKGGSKHPIIFPPAPELKKQQIRDLAERMFRQSAGLENPNNKTLMQLRREQDLPVDVRVLAQQKDLPTVDYEKLKNAYLIGVPGDPSIGGAVSAGSEVENAKPAVTIRGIGEKAFESDVPQWGGKDYGTYGHSQGWAGNISGVRPLTNVAKEMSEIDPEAKILGQYVKMSPESLDFALHNLDTLLAYQQPEKFPKKYKDRLTKLIRGKYAHHEAFPSFPGFDKPEDVMLQAQVDSKLRKKLVHVLSVKGNLPPKTPSAEDVVFAVSHPDLRNLETGASGSTILQIDPTVDPADLKSPHPTYSNDLPSSVIGKSKYMAPVEVAFPRSINYAKGQIEKLPEHKRKSVLPFNMAKMIGLREPIDEQYINQLGEYEMEMKKRRGYKKGGKPNMDAMRLALINKKAK